MKTMFLLWTTLWVGLAFPTASQAAPVPAPDQLAPDDTVFLLTVPDWGKICRHFATTPETGLWRDPAMQPFLDHLMLAFKKYVTQPLEKELDIKLADFEGLVSGQMSMAITRNTWQPNVAGPDAGDVGFLLVMDVGGHADSLTRLLEDVRSKRTAAGKEVRVVKIHNHDFIAHGFETDDLRGLLDKVFPDPAAGSDSSDKRPVRQPAPGRKPAPARKANKHVEWIVGQHESLFIIGSVANDIEKLLGRLAREKDAGNSLAAYQGFKPSAAAMLRESMAFFWADTETLMEVAMANLNDPKKRGAKPGQDAKAVVEALGLFGLKSVAFNLTHDGAGGGMKVLLEVPPAERKGLFKILAPLPKDAGPPPFVSAEVHKFFRYRLDFQRVKEMVEGFMAAAAGPGAAGKPNPVSEALKVVFTQLGDDLVYFSKWDQTESWDDYAQAPNVFLIGSPSADPLLNYVRFFLGLQSGGKMQFKEQEMAGTKVYSLPTSIKPGGKPGGEMPKEGTSVATTKDYLAIANNVAMLAAFLENKGGRTSLRERPGLAQTAEKVGGFNCGLFAFEDQKASLEHLFAALKKNPAKAAEKFCESELGGRLGMQDEPKRFQEWFDLTLLPDFKQVEKYLDISVVGLQETPAGFELKVYTPIAPGLKAAAP